MILYITDVTALGGNGTRTYGVLAESCLFVTDRERDIQQVRIKAILKLKSINKRKRKKSRFYLCDQRLTC